MPGLMHRLKGAVEPVFDWDLSGSSKEGGCVPIGIRCTEGVLLPYGEAKATGWQGGMLREYRVEVWQSASRTGDKHHGE